MANAPVLTWQTQPSMEKVQFQLAEWGDAPVNWNHVWRDVTKMFYAHERQLFDTDGRGKAAGKHPAWAPLSERYRVVKERKRPGRKILTYDGKLKSALTGGAGSKKIFAGPSMMAFIGDPTVRNYAQAHATGVTSRNLPARPPVRYEGAIRNGTFGYAVSQIVQSHIVLARKKVLSKDVEKAIDLDGAKAVHTRQIKSMIKGAWK